MGGTGGGNGQPSRGEEGERRAPAQRRWRRGGAIEEHSRLDATIERSTRVRSCFHASKADRRKSAHAGGARRVNRGAIASCGAVALFLALCPCPFPPPPGPFPPRRARARFFEPLQAFSKRATRESTTQRTERKEQKEGRGTHFTPEDVRGHARWRGPRRWRGALHRKTRKECPGALPSHQSSNRSPPQPIDRCV